ncbi:MAG: TonB-dependent receptor [Alphaproteobacteria bacterium]|nr:TonB-dependent receptor [Alphaproteobacteria bacterium]
MSKKSNWGRILLSGASLAAMGALASPALAQDSDEVTDEIVVTATGRAAAIQDVPLAVTAVSGEQLENSGVQDLRDVTQVAPSLQMGTGQSNSSGTIARIRGIGTGSDNPGFEGAVGIFIDGVYRARAGAALADLPELERVEILRGPQGTLFGRNTSAGAISVVSAGPRFEPGMYIQGDYGLDDLEEVGLEAGVNMPVSDSLALRFDGVVRDRGGYITDTTTGDDINSSSRWSARGQALWDISPDASLRLILDAAESDSVCCGAVYVSYGTTTAIISALTGGGGATPSANGGVPPINPEARLMSVTSGRGYGETTEEIGFSGQLDWDLGGINLTSITAVRDWKAVRDQDIDFTRADIAYRDGLEVGIENFTQEIRLQGEVGRVNWLVGAFYADESIDQTDTIRVGAQASAFSNAAVSGLCAASPSTVELFNICGGGVPSIFQGVLNNPAGPFAGVAPGRMSPAQLLAANLAILSVNPGPNAGSLVQTVAGNGQQADVWNVQTQSLSVFTHNEISLTDNLILTLGARYSDETKDLDANLNAVNPTCASLQQMELATTGLLGTNTAAPGFPLGIVRFIEGTASGATAMALACNPAVNPIANGHWTGSRQENEFSGTASLAYHLNDDVMIYGGYSRGYKAGGFNIDRSGFSIRPSTTSASALNVGQLAFEPEFTDSYEAGIKTTLFGGTTTFNVTGFYQQIHDYQSNNFNGFNFITRNVPEVISQGVELEMAANPFEGLNINAGVTYTDAYYDSTVTFNALDPIPNTINAGDPLSFAPEWVATGAIAYRVPISANLGALFYLDGRWNSEYRTQTLNRTANTDQGSFAVFNGRVGIGPQNERWSVELFGQNLTDEFYFVGAFAPPLQNSRVVFPNEPRTYGVSVRLQY